MFICLAPWHPRCRWLCFISRTQTKIFLFKPLQSDSYIMAVNGTHGFWESLIHCNVQLSRARSQQPSRRIRGSDLSHVYVTHYLQILLLNMVINCAYPDCCNLLKIKRLCLLARTHPGVLTFHQLPTFEPDQLKLWLFALRLISTHPWQIASATSTMPEHVNTLLFWDCAPSTNIYEVSQ